MGQKKKNTADATTVDATTTSLNHGGNKKIIKDDRFSSVHFDPRFQNNTKHQSKVSIDPRFINPMRTNKNFISSKTRIDKRGKLKDPNSENPLLRYYKQEEELKPKKKKNIKQKQQEQVEEVTEEETKKEKKEEKKNTKNREEEKYIINGSESEANTEEEEQLEEDSSSPSEEELEEETKNKNKNKNKKKKKKEKNSREEESILDGSESELEVDLEEEKLESDDSDNEIDADADADADYDTSTTGSDTDDDEDGVGYDEQESEEPEENIPMIEQETRRLAIVNLDWSQIRAVDLYVLMSSFLPKGGQILSVSVYPSEFGLKRMEEEAVKGPVGLFDSEEEKSDSDDDNNEIDEEKLRAYEKSRLRYYYAVVECDSSATADYLYKSCDGTEFERTSNVLDLRFIPDSMEFKHPSRDVATEAPTNYEAVDFHTQALQHSNIHLSWEEDEPQRAKMLKRTFNADQLDALEFKEFIASDDGDSGDDENDDLQEKYRALLQAGDGSDGNGSEDGGDMEVSFNPGLEDLSKHILKRKKDKESETVWEAQLRKDKEKRRSRKNRPKKSDEEDSGESDREAPEQPDDFFVDEPSGKSNKAGKISRKKQQEQEANKEAEASRAELELLLADDEGADGHLKGYNLKPKKGKGKKGKELPVEDKLPAIDYNDPRLLVFKSPQFALDPTDPQYKRSAAYARQVAQKQHGTVSEEPTEGERMSPSRHAPLATDDMGSKRDEQLQRDSGTSNKDKYEISSLVRSIKRKTHQAQVPSNGRPSKRESLELPDSPLMKKEKHELSSLVRSIKRKTQNAKDLSGAALQSDRATKKKRKS